LYSRFCRFHLQRRDNDGPFRSPLFALALRFLGIRHQRIDPFCPWQNGRIERLFWTLKERLQRWWKRAGVPDDAQDDLSCFRVWYNHARPHQSLDGITPAMAWAGVTQPANEPCFFNAWDDILTGFVTPT
jgi:transposase InsO family protein